MRFLEITADEFGPFTASRLQLAEGMNVFVGANETGKSSWLAAIYAALCGRRRGPGVRRFDRNFQEQHQPWGSDVWGASCTLSLIDGTELEIRHELTDHSTCHVVDRVTGEDLTSTLLAEQCPDGAKLLGLSREIMWATLFVRQARVMADLDASDGLQAALQRAADAGEEKATATMALQHLDNHLRTDVGTERAPAKPLLRTRLELRKAESALEKAEEKRREVQRLHEKRQILVAEALEAEKALTILKAWNLYQRASKLTDRVSRIETLARHFPELTPPPAADEIDDVIGQLERALAKWDESEELPPAPEGPSSDDLNRELDALPAHPTGDLEPADEVEDALILFRSTQATLDMSQPMEESLPGLAEVDSTPTELRQLASSIEASETGPPAERGIPWLALLGVALAVGGASVLIAGETVVGVLLLVAGSLGVAVGGIPWMLRRELHGRPRSAEEAARERIRELALTPSVSDLRALATDMERAQGDSRQSRYEELRDELQSARQGLIDLIEQHGTTVRRDETPEAAFARYEQACHRRMAQSIQASRRPHLRERLATQKHLEDQYSASLERRRAIHDEINELANAVGIADGESPEAQIERLSERLEQLRSARFQLNDQWKQWLELQALCEGRTISEWKTESKQATETLETMGGRPEGAAPQNLEQDLESAQKTLQEIREQRERLDGEISTREEEIPDIATLEERVQNTSLELEHLENRSRIIRQAMEFLEEAQSSIYKMIAPGLKKSIEERLARVTDDRYREAAVDPDTLKVRVKTPSGTWQPAENLSHGTAEQVYLLLRIALAEQLSTTDEPAFLVLDDVTVQSDDSRTIRLLELLHELSEQRQIVLFTQEEVVERWAEGALTDPRDRFAHFKPVKP